MSHQTEVATTGQAGTKAAKRKGCVVAIGALIALLTRKGHAAAH